MPPYKGVTGSVSAGDLVIEDDSYYEQIYSKPAKFGDYIIFDPTAADYENDDLNTNLPSEYSMPIYYKPIPFQNNHNNAFQQPKQVVSNSNNTLKKSEKSSNNIYSHLNHAINVNFNNENKSLFFSTRN